MARGGGKRAKASAQPSSQTLTTIATNPPSVAPAPFKVAPVGLQPFASTLPTDHVYLVHIDRTPVSLKKRVFVVPVLLNVVITLILCVRVYYAVPVYLNQLITIFGYETAYSVDTKNTAAPGLIDTITSRTFLLMIDYAIFVLLGSWPREFVFGSKISRYISPFDWRTTVGFEEDDIIVRRARKWDLPLLQGIEEGERLWTPQDELIVQNKIEPAMRRSYTSKTAFTLLDKDWDLDFKGIIDAHRLVKDGRVKQTDLQDIALVYYNKQWIVWRVHEALETQEAIKDDKVDAFKDKLTGVGGEGIFYRWIELVQYETSQPGGLTNSRQESALQELRSMLRAKDVDDAAFLDQLGGTAALPGFDA